MSRNDNRDTAGAEKREAEASGVQQQVQPASAPLLVTRKQADIASAEPKQSNVVDISRYRVEQQKPTIEETLVTEWQLTPGSTDPLVKLIMVSSGFGGKRSSISRHSDIQCIAA